MHEHLESLENQYGQHMSESSYDVNMSVVPATFVTRERFPRTVADIFRKCPSGRYVSEAGVTADVEIAMVVVSMDVKLNLLSASLPAARALHFTRRRDDAPKSLARRFSRHSWRAAFTRPHSIIHSFTLCLPGCLPRLPGAVQRPIR